MNKIVKVSLMVLGGIIVLLIGYIAYLGVFSSLQVTEKPVGPYTYAYKSFVGDYKLTGSLFNDVYTTLKNKNIGVRLGIGVYYDNPATVPVAELRSDCGFVIADKDAKLITATSLKVASFKKADCLVVEFPIRNMVSYFIGPMKAYPALAAYAKAKKYKDIQVAYEFYDEQNKKTMYVVKVAK